jgi:hypothetical protein
MNWHSPRRAKARMKQAVATLAVLSVMMASSGCSSSARKLDPLRLPPLSADLVSLPSRPLPRASDDARLALARETASNTQCRSQYRDLKSFYGQFRESLKRG